MRNQNLIFAVVHLLGSLLNIAQLLLCQGLHHVGVLLLLLLLLLPPQEGHPVLGLVEVGVPRAVGPLPRSLEHLSLLAGHPCLPCLLLLCCVSKCCQLLFCSAYQVWAAAQYLPC